MIYSRKARISVIMPMDKRKGGREERRRTWTRRARSDRRNLQNKNWILPMYITEARDGSTRRDGMKLPPERAVKLPILPKIFRVRSIYLKVKNMDAAREFYSEFLGIPPKKDGNVWCEFPMGNMNFALSLDQSKGKTSGVGGGFVPIFEFADNEIYRYAHKAKSLGATIIVDSISEGRGQTILMRDPFGNEFEISRQHD